MRAAKGWTQQHLADACSVSLRTVQRVECYGNASNETTMSLCAVFEIARGDIVEPDSTIEEVVSIVNVEHMINVKTHLFALTIGSCLGGAATFSLLNWMA